MREELKKARGASAAEMLALKKVLQQTETRLAEVDAMSQEEAAQRQAAARHELTLEKAAASKAAAGAQHSTANGRRRRVGAA